MLLWLMGSCRYSRGMTPKLVDESEQAEVDAAWDTEIDERLDEILTGKVELVSGEKTLEMVREMLAARRQQ